MMDSASYEGAVIGAKVCEGRMSVTQDDIDKFCAMMGYDDPAYRADAEGGAIAPVSMCLTYGLRLGWETDVFPEGAIRMGDENRYGVSARPDDNLVTVLRITKKFERKNRKFLDYEMTTSNQAGQMVCVVTLTAIVP